MASTRRRTGRLEGNLANDVLPSPAMTTQPGWEPRPGPTRGETARRAPRGAAGGWPDDPARRRAGGPGASGRSAPPPARATGAAGIRATGQAGPAPTAGEPVVPGRHASQGSAPATARPAD